MPITSPLKISWRGVSVGGDTDIPIAGPYIVERNYERFLLVFNILVTETTQADLVTTCTTLEETFGGRLGYTASDQDLVIQFGGSDDTFTYTHGETIFNADSTITKSGDADSDGPLSRLYTIRISGEMPESQGGGLREFEVLVSLDESRVHLVTMRGTYLAQSNNGNPIDGVAQYEAEFDGVASNYLNYVDSNASWELVSEVYNVDRNPGSTNLPNPHKCNFERQYRELIYNETQGSLDDDDIVNHRINFAKVEQHVDNGREDAERLQRVIASYDSGLNNENNPDAKSVVEDKVIPYLRTKFQELYNPQEWCVEEQRAGFDPAALKISVTLRFAFIPEEAGQAVILEAQESVQHRENRSIDYTFVHGGGELDAYAAPGFAVKERVYMRSITAIGDQSAIERMFPEGAGGGGGAIGAWTTDIEGQPGLDTLEHKQVNEAGWNTISSSSQVVPIWQGQGSEGQRFKKVQIVDTAVQRYNQTPGVGGSSGPITPGGG